jgi:hypothetical protein
MNVVDLRAMVRSEPGTLSRRPAGFAGRKVLLFDNGKMSPPHEGFTAVPAVLGAALAAAAADVTVTRMTRDLLIGDGRVAAAAADAIAAAGVDGVIIGLLDQGVSQASVLFAADLERRGIPTSLVCQGAGGRLARAMAEMLVPGLPVSVLDADKSATYPEIEAAAQRIAGTVLSGLTSAGPAQSPVAKEPEPSLELTLDGADTSFEYSELMAAAGIGDGLPLLAPTAQRVERLLAASGIDPERELWPVIRPRSAPVTARDVAAVAVAAGCRPEAFAVVAAAYEVMARPEFRVYQAAITTHPGGTLVLVSGPAAARLGFFGGAGCLGPGPWSNASAGRAVALAYSVFFNARPGGASLCVQGSPAQFSYCCAEAAEESPWPSLAAELFGDGASSVTVLKGEGPHAVLDDVSTGAVSLLGTVAAGATSIASNNAYRPSGQLMVLLNPGHARLLARAGWSKADVRHHLFEVARNDPGRMAGRGGHRGWPDWFTGLELLPVVQQPDDILVVVAGEPGPHSAVVRPWPVSRGSTVALTSG